jgi:hypothetical protein
MVQNTESEIQYFLKELLNPEGYGWAVSDEVRTDAKRLLNMIIIDDGINNEQNSTVRSKI